MKAAATSEPLLSVLSDGDGFYFLDEDGDRSDNYDSKREAEYALGWHMEDSYWSPESEEA